MIEWILIALFAGAVGLLQPDDNMVVLLAEEDGSVGRVVVRTNGGEQVLDQAGSATTFAGTEEAPSAPRTLTAEEINSEFGKVLDAHPPIPLFFKLYFETGGATLTPESKARVSEILQAAKDRKHARVSVIGHTDRQGSAALNAELARKRAVVMKDLLVAAGLPTEALTVRSHGENDPIVPTADEVDEPRNRRVEINIR
ncbi:OmpA family protein [Magnetospira sp. QH-2]|uniref:OmpA family protein n=1 Tax=Magnetospira sp. (strain QH-2) TaxID=1288970 RepID=UPI0003E80F33